MHIYNIWYVIFSHAAPSHKEGITHGEEKIGNKEGYSSKSGLSGIDTHCWGSIRGPLSNGSYSVPANLCNTSNASMYNAVIPARYRKCSLKNRLRHC